tara:strand:+ start:1643 stop:1882 length:240 start_codon:yes stop_codon:yes gene_type:complete
MQITTKNKVGDIIYSQIVSDENMNKITSLLMTSPKVAQEGLDTEIACNGNDLGFTNQGLDLMALIKTANGIPVRKARVA